MMLLVTERTAELIRPGFACCSVGIGHSERVILGPFHNAGSTDAVLDVGQVGGFVVAIATRAFQEPHAEIVSC